MFLIRSAIIILGAYIYGKRDGVNFSISKVRSFPHRMQKSLFIRSFHGFGAILAAMIAIQLTPVSVAVSIMMTQVFASSLAGYCLAGEKISVKEGLAIFGGFCGVLILTNDKYFS